MRTAATETYRPSEAARIIGVSRMTIYRWIESGRLMPIMIFNNHPRIPREQVDDIILGIK